MDFNSYISEGLLMLVPAMYVLGVFLKRTEHVSDRYIPLILLTVSCLITQWINGFYEAESVVQGILVAGAAVLGNELVKQTKRGDE